MLIKTLKIKFTFFIAALVLLISAVNFCIFYILVPGSLKENKTIIIKQKLSISQITQELYQNKVIKCPILFELIAKIYSLNTPLKSGEYIFTEHISPFQTLKILANGKSIIHKMIIPEGITVNEIIRKINEEDRLIGEIIGLIPEGYLMPSTYFYSYGDQKEQLIDRMRKLMSSNLDAVMEQLSPHSPLKTRLEVLILASIVEKEAGFDAEKPMIAAVFLNRLKKNMKLQADPTTIYALTEGKSKLNRALTRKDLMIISEYNTYYIKGLPPGPIACPSLKSLQAVVNPAETDAIFFVANGMGGHNFSNNISDHNRHVESYRTKVRN